MSPKGLLALLLVGLCATQMASASYRQSRQVQALMDSANEKMNGVLKQTEDAARSSLETVLGFLKKLELGVLEAANQKLAEMGFPLDLVVVSELFRSNANDCVTNDVVKAQATEIIGDMSSCISSDADSLKGMVKDMQELWATAKTLPESMKVVAAQCSEHAHEQVPEDMIAEEELPKDETDHDLAPIANELMDDAAHHMNKRWLWGFGRITRCVKSIYALTKNDLMTLPGQILSCAANAYKVMKASGGNTYSCVSERTTNLMPQIKSLSVSVGTCMAKMDLGAMMATNPKLAGLKKMVDLTQSYANGGAMAALSSLGGVGGIADLADKFGGVSGIADIAGKLGGSGGVAELAANLGSAKGVAELAEKFGGAAGVSALAEKLGGAGGVAELAASLGGTGGVAEMAEKLGGAAGVTALAEKLGGAAGIADLAGKLGGAGVSAKAGAGAADAADKVNAVAASAPGAASRVSKLFG